MLHKIQLKNGLKVLIYETHKSPVVTIQMWVNVGSADEKPSEQGLSHFIEHLLFKGTEKYIAGEIAALVEASGGEINASTSFDETIYHVTLSSQFVNIGINIISQMIGHPTFELKEIDNEREVVIEEIKKGLDSPQRQSIQSLFSTIYRHHPYKYPIIGKESIIRHVSRKKLVQYFRNYYHPKNMFLLIAGDVESDKIKKEIISKFGSLKKYNFNKVQRKKNERPPNKIRISIKELPFETAYLHLGWPIPHALHKDIPGLDLLSSILGQGDSSRLTKKLMIEEPLANACSASTFTPKDPGFFSVSAVVNIDNLEKILTTIKNQVNEISTTPPNIEEMHKIITNYESHEFYGLETVDGLAQKIGHFYMLTGDPNYHKKYLKQIYQLKPKALCELANKYLTPDRLSVVITTQKDKSKIETLVKEIWQTSKKLKAQHSFKKVNKKDKYRAIKFNIIKNKQSNKIEKQILPLGTTVILRPNYETPVCSIKLAFLGGVRVEPDNLEGATELMSRCWPTHTKSICEQDLHLKLDSMAASLTAFGGRNTVGLSLDYLSPFENEILEIFNEVLTQPLFDNETIEREKILQMENIKIFEDSPGQVVIQNFLATIFQGHPYAKRLIGTKSSIVDISKQEITELWKKQSFSKNLVIVVTGCFDDKIIQKLTQITNQLPKGEKLKKIYSVKKMSSEEKIFFKLNREQTHIFLGYQGIELDHPKKYALHVIASLLGGQGGRLFVNLRDRASLAYSVSPMHMEGIDAGYFGAYIGCSPDKGERAIQMLKDEFEKLKQNLVSESELNRAKNYLVGRHDIDLQTNRSIAGSILFNVIYDLPYNETFDYPEKIKSVTAFDLREISQEIFSKPGVISAVGVKPPWS